MYIGVKTIQMQFIKLSYDDNYFNEKDLLTK